MRKEYMPAQRNWPVPFFTDKRDTDANFEKLARLLLESREWVQLACASHNVRSIAWVMETAKDLKVPPDKVEYQVLYGMAEPLQKALVKAGTFRSGSMRPWENPFRGWPTLSDGCWR